jgi:hypothetical protein
LVHCRKNSNCGQGDSVEHLLESALKQQGKAGVAALNQRACFFDAGSGASAHNPWANESP